MQTRGGGIYYGNRPRRKRSTASTATTTTSSPSPSSSSSDTTDLGGMAVEVVVFVEKSNKGGRRRKEIERVDDGCRWKRRKTWAPVSSPTPPAGDFDLLPDDILLCILSKFSSTASRPEDFVSLWSTCKKLRELGRSPQVLLKASLKSLTVPAARWSESAHRFVKCFADAGNLEACYLLGMIRFYCLEQRATGASMMAKAAMGSHAAALYSLAVIQFNGSGGAKNDKDLRAGVALCARAAFLGHVDAIRELGHCLQDGYGIRRNVPEGRRFLVQANARELAAVGVNSDGKAFLLSDFGCHVPLPETHPANRFLVDWFAGRKVEDADGAEDSGLRLCSHVGCGRPETRRHEFRRCSVCGFVNYCSRACQALDWKLRHKAECTPMERWLNEVFQGVAVPPVGVPPDGVPPVGVPPDGVPPVGVPPVGRMGEENVAGGGLDG